MDTSDSKIVFDENGICDHCNTFYAKIQHFLHTDEKRSKKLEELVSKINKEGKGKDFDYLMGMNF